MFTSTSKSELSEQLATLTADFVASGGVIKELDAGIQRDVLADSQFSAWIGGPVTATVSNELAGRVHVVHGMTHRVYTAV